MSHLLDTDICSAYLRGHRQVLNRFIQHSGELYISIVSLAELYSWVHLTNNPAKREEGLLSMLSDLTVLHLDDDSPASAARFGQTCNDMARPSPRSTY